MTEDGSFVDRDPSGGAARDGQRLAEYAAASAATPLPAEVIERAGLHVLDTIAAMVGGSVLPAGLAAHRYLAMNRDTQGPCVVVGTGMTSSVEGAALANGMSAHADETDDSHERSTTHPGCGIVPAALAAAQAASASGQAFLNAVVLGYDVGTRLPMSLAAEAFDLRRSNHASHAFGPMFGAAYAAGALQGLDAHEFVALTSYIAQELSGLTTWQHDKEHVLKAYVFGGMPASTGVRVSRMVSAGWPGGGDVLDDPHRTMPEAFGATAARASAMVAGLGVRYAITETNLKRYAVGSPIQAVIQAVDYLIAEHQLTAADVDEVRVHLHPRLADVVSGSRMPAVNCQYCVAITLEDGFLSYASAHDEQRMEHATTSALMKRVVIIPDLPDPARREALVQVQQRNGSVLTRHETAVLGTKDRPMDQSQLVDKALELLRPVLGNEQADTVVRLSLSLPTQRTLDELAQALTIRG